ncbi:MAG: AbrB/MazE/SpoVT family DNA-binding domain-containing protein [Candidatus Sumerlaeota bacterium]|nr:AbrB/MazE/SpoVT family DNA-binding domain-containing protein [Candidatus Sumerlaeota bacterium]
MTATVTSKGQVTLPAEARRRLGIRAGTRLEFIITDDDRLEVVRIGGSVRDLKGALPKPARALSLAEMDDAIAAGARRAGR